MNQFLLKGLKKLKILKYININGKVNIINRIGY